MDNEILLEHFYHCFENRDFRGMQRCYHPDARFQDPVFGKLDSREVQSMWEMLLKRAQDLSVKSRNLVVAENKGYAEWTARYTFSSTGRLVINHVHSEFQFADGLIIYQSDTFDFYTWSKQSLGFMGFLLGRTGFLQRKIARQARKNLLLFMSKKNH